MNIDLALERLFGHEGKYSNHPRDPGGETMWGITIAVARANGYQGPMKLMPKAFAIVVYRKKYWNAVQADLLPEFLRFDVFDAAVNSGPQQAIEWLQQAVGETADGQLGPRTLGALASTDSLAAGRFNGYRLMDMTNMRWEEFGKGWARRVAANLIALRS